MREVKKISFGENVLYEPESGLRGLSEDETAIAALMIDTAKYSRGEENHHIAWRTHLQMLTLPYCLMKR